MGPLQGEFVEVGHTTTSTPNHSESELQVVQVVPESLNIQSLGLVVMVDRSLGLLLSLIPHTHA